MLFKYKNIEGLWCIVTTKQMIQLDFCHSFLHAFAYCDKSFLETTLAPWCTGDYLYNINNAPVFCSDKHIYIMMLLLIIHPSVNTFQYDWFCYQHIFFFQLLVACACGGGVMEEVNWLDAQISPSVSYIHACVRDYWSWVCVTGV